MQSSTCLIIFLAIIASSLTVEIEEETSQLDLSAIPKNTYPVRFGYVSRISEWWPA